MVLDFPHHLSSQRRSTFEDEPVYYLFRVPIQRFARDSPDVALRAHCSSARPLLPFQTKDMEDLQEMAIVILPELSGQLFTLDKAFKGSRKAQAFVE